MTRKEFFSRLSETKTKNLKSIGLEVNQHFENGDTPLTSSCSIGMDVNYTDGKQSLLMEAAYYNFPKLCEFPIKNGADTGYRAGVYNLNATNGSGSTPIFMAVAGGQKRKGCLPDREWRRLFYPTGF